MTCEELFLGKSFFHHCDPRVKLVVLAAMAIIVATLKTITFEVLALILALIFLVLAHLPGRAVFLRVVAFNCFCLFIWLTVPFSPGGVRLFHILGPISIYKEGVFSALSVTIKSNTILFLTLSLLATSEITDITHALSHLRCPSRMVQLFFFTWRYIHVITEEAGRLQEAMQLRGFRPGTDLRTYRSFGYFLSALFVKSFDTGLQVQRAMELRGFDGTFWLINHFEFRQKDLAFLLGCLMVTVGLFLGDNLAATG